MPSSSGSLDPGRSRARSSPAQVKAGLEQAHLPQARAFRAREDQVIEDGAVERVCRRGEATRDLAIGVARSGVAARMIVGEDKTRGAVPRSIDDDRPQWEPHAALITLVTAHVKTTRLVIHMSHPKALAPNIVLGETTREELPRRCEAIELQRRFGTLISHAR